MKHQRMTLVVLSAVCAGAFVLVLLEALTAWPSALDIVIATMSAATIVASGVGVGWIARGASRHVHEASPVNDAGAERDREFVDAAAGGGAVFAPPFGNGADRRSLKRRTVRAAHAEVARALSSGGVVTALQPTVSVSTGLLMGVEVLSRFNVPGSDRSPECWFVEAARSGLGIELDVHAALGGLRAARVLPADAYVSINLSTGTILWPGIADCLATTPIDSARIVIEVTEHEPVADYARLEEALQPLRDRGMRVAVDDAGSGYASLRHILKIAPDFIKLDRSIISAVDSGAAHRAITAAIVTFARETDSTVIAEGVETTSELAILRELGVTAAQGYLFQRPTTNPDDWGAFARPLPWEGMFPSTPAARQGVPRPMPEQS